MIHTTALLLTTLLALPMVVHEGSQQLAHAPLGSQQAEDFRWVARAPEPSTGAMQKDGRSFWYFTAAPIIEIRVFNAAESPLELTSFEVDPIRNIDQPDAGERLPKPKSVTSNVAFEVWPADESKPVEFRFKGSFERGGESRTFQGHITVEAVHPGGVEDGKTEHLSLDRVVSTTTYNPDYEQEKALRARSVENSRNHVRQRRQQTRQEREAERAQADAYRRQEKQRRREQSRAQAQMYHDMREKLKNDLNEVAEQQRAEQRKTARLVAEAKEQKRQQAEARAEERRSAQQAERQRQQARLEQQRQRAEAERRAQERAEEERRRREEERRRQAEQRAEEQRRERERQAREAEKRRKEEAKRRREASKGKATYDRCTPSKPTTVDTENHKFVGEVCLTNLEYPYDKISAKSVSVVYSFGALMGEPVERFAISWKAKPGNEGKLGSSTIFRASVHAPGLPVVYRVFNVDYVGKPDSGYSEDFTGSSPNWSRLFTTRNGGSVSEDQAKEYFRKGFTLKHLEILKPNGHDRP